MKRMFFEYIPAWLLLTILGFIVLHAPITVFVASHWPGVGLYVKAWKELLMILAGVLIITDYVVSKRWKTVAKDTVLWLAGGLIVIHLISIAFSQGSFNSIIAGLMIDLRYVAYFVLVYLFLKRYPDYRPSFLKIALLGAAIVVGFAFLQVFLPPDFLKYFGYSSTTIEPYMTVDNNPDYIRQSSTLRGPNPLGAYAIMVLAGVIAFGSSIKGILRDKRLQYISLLLAIGGVIALWGSYSRGAWLGAAVAIAIVLIATFHRRITRKMWRYVILAAVIALVGLYMIRDTSFIQNVIVHNNPTTGAAIDSNQGHLDSLQSGLAQVWHEPFGAGIGSTGSASLFGDNSMVIENQYLFVAHEAGWLGLVIFLVLVGAVLRELWKRRSDWKALAVFASGIGLLVVGLILPVWVDDTISIVWWGLAAVIISEEGVEHARASNKKTKRAA